MAVSYAVLMFIAMIAAAMAQQAAMVAGPLTNARPITRVLDVSVSSSITSSIERPSIAPGGSVFLNSCSSGQVTVRRLFS